MTIRTYSKECSQLKPETLVVSADVCMLGFWFSKVPSKGSVVGYPALYQLAWSEQAYPH